MRVRAISYTVPENLGGNKKVWTIYFWQTPWKKYLKPLYKNEQYNTNLLPLFKVKKIYDKEGKVLWEEKDK